MTPGYACQMAGWTFLTNHAHVMVCLERDPGARLRDIALAVGITERAAQRIITELEEGGYLTRERDGRRNRYSLRRSGHLRHPLEGKAQIGELLDLLADAEVEDVAGTGRDALRRAERRIAAV